MSTDDRVATEKARFAAWSATARSGGSPAQPAATVVVLRDGPTGPETRMLKKNSKIAFGGMWVFPGGKVDSEDRTDDPDDDVIIDEGEIVDMEWTTPAEAIARHHEGEIEIVPPTWVTLDTLRGHSDVDALLRFLRARPARHHATKVAGGDEHPVVMWEGDAGYESADARVEGPRHRLTMRPTGYVYEDDGVDG